MLEIQVRQLLPLFDNFHKTGRNGGIVKVHRVLVGGQVWRLVGMLHEHVVNVMQQTVSFGPFIEGKVQASVSWVIGGPYMRLEHFRVHWALVK